ncbi:hypothetical protein [Extibacter muris]|uniref:Uncharacterized protein n=1 Tax=Extibacter muris TaxID=1796622 RepID=A0A4R4FEU3_9FIRM|nr:hypothetical protein [Extibacter muris]MCU0079361.1 hypothetical protein [Extibacter muris]TDA21918.1 hypothetical protein E1963_09150 [Extibacter muris]
MWHKGDKCYIIENNMHIRPATVVRSGGGFCVIRFGSGKGIRIRESRLYRTPEEAAMHVRYNSSPRRTHYDYE